MGVFARLLRRSKAKEEAATAETQADTPSAGSEADEAGEAKGTTEAEAEAGAGTETTTATDEGDGTGPEAVGIPQQQSAGKAADSEADEGAHT
ncbi:hypothetical protein [Streptomyces sp. PSKA30]|uniref:hypothetical protein n=1 Tax=Streptomyces sp. PSKA30 TaxID=2874597 RepID=UPI001CD1230C|nr:hypothetical protein [Streptomyces sp. PSKA30]MBZ9639518.1 hypothetical protein [Streptomyces sp. PSKA30]